MSFAAYLTLLWLWLCLMAPAASKVFQRCELHQLLRQQYGLPEQQAATLVCIAQHSSQLNTAAFGGGTGPGGGSHGLFQISDVYWCSPPGHGAGCGLSCARLRDDDIGDDVLCVRKIFAEHLRISGDGFTAWQAYQAYCHQDAASYVADCARATTAVLAVPQQHHYYPPQQQKRQQGKIYSRCELAQELYYQHKLPMQQIPTWVCIAQHESSYNTAAVGRLNADGSADHGLFQISDLYWCTHEPGGGKGCHSSCDQFLDTSIADDVQCIRRIYQEHTHISGDGFTAWTVYNRNCRNQRYEQIAACFAKPPAVPVTPVTHPNAIAGGIGSKLNKVSYAQPTAVSHYKHQANPFLPRLQPSPQLYPNSIAGSKLSYAQSTAVSHYKPSSHQANPFLPRLPQSHPNAIAGYHGKPHISHSVQHTPANPFHKYQQPKPPQNTHTYTSSQHQHQQQQHYYHTPSRHLGKVYTRCELAQELYYSHKFPMQDIATWVCIAEHESRFNTAAVGRLNADGSADHGLFQISDIYWCAHEPGGGKACNIACDKLLDADITDDVQCIRTIHAEHTRLSGDGFNAWTVYQPHCRQRSKADIASCFEPNLTQMQRQPVQSSSKPPKGKVYSRCELAQELYYQHKLPMHQIPTWVCIAQHESSYNTAAVGRLNADGSADHGLFQISDLYWCAHEPGGGKACNIACDKLLDADISDDVRCIRTIHEEHTRISGDGFNAWTVYQPHCRQQSLALLSDCFKGNEIASSQQQHHPEKPQQRAVPAGNPFLPLIAAATAPRATAHSKPTGVVANPLLSNQPYASNPFLAHLQPKSYAQPKPTSIASKPKQRLPQVVPAKTDYANNPFLNGLFSKSESPAKTLMQSDKKSQTKLLQAVPTKSSYVKNPFLNGLFAKPISLATPSVQSFKMTQSELNPFLHKPSINRPTQSYIVSDSFRHEFGRIPTTVRPTTSRTTTLKAPITRTTITTTTTRPTTRPAKATNRVSTTMRPFAFKLPTLTATTRPTKRQTTATIKQTTRSTTIPTTRPATATQTTRSVIHATIATKTAQATRSTQTARQTTRSTKATKQATESKSVAQQIKQTTARPTPTTYKVAQVTREFPRFVTATQTKTNFNQIAHPTLSTRQTTPQAQPTRQTLRNTEPTRQTTRSTTTTRQTTAGRQTASPKITTRPTTRLTTTRQATHFTQPTKQTTRLTTRQTTTQPIIVRINTQATRPTQTTRQATHQAQQVTRPTVRPAGLARQTTHQTQATRPTTRSTTTARPATTSPKVTTRPTTRLTTTRQTTALPFTTAWLTTTHKETTTTRPHSALWSWSTTPRLHSAFSSTTPRPYLFTPSSTTTRGKATTTRRPLVAHKTTADPFSHPFFDQFRALFSLNRLTATPTAAAANQSTALNHLYAKFQQNNANSISQTFYAYQISQNSTTTATTTRTTTRRPTTPTQAAPFKLN